MAGNRGLLLEPRHAFANGHTCRLGGHGFFPSAAFGYGIEAALGFTLALFYPGYAKADRAFARQSGHFGGNRPKFDPCVHILRFSDTDSTRPVSMIFMNLDTF